jgi:hypothetical protein
MRAKAGVVLTSTRRADTASTIVVGADEAGPHEAAFTAVPSTAPVSSTNSSASRRE